jgi:hypothetical protein
VINLNLKGLLAAIESLIAPFEKLAAYFAVGGIGVANYPNLPITLRAVITAVGALLIKEAHVATAATPTAKGAPVPLPRPAPAPAPPTITGP